MNTQIPELPFRDIHLPDSSTWWPLAPGWWISLTILIGLCILITTLLRKYLNSSLKKDAKKELKAIENAFERTQDATRCLADLSILLRRAVVSQKQEQIPVAGITGLAWLKLLDQHLGTSEFSQGPGRILLVGPYQPNETRIMDKYQSGAEHAHSKELASSLKSTTIPERACELHSVRVLPTAIKPAGLSNSLVNEREIEHNDVEQLIKLCRKWVNRL